MPSSFSSFESKIFPSFIVWLLSFSQFPTFFQPALRELVRLRLSKIFVARLGIKGYSISAKSCNKATSR